MKWFKALLFASVLALFAPLSEAAISVVQSTSTSNFGGTTITITATTTPTVNNYVLVGFGSRGVPVGLSVASVADNQTGNTFSAVVTGNGSGQGLSSLYLAKVNAATGTYSVTVTLSASTSDNVAWLMEVSGISGATDQSGTSVVSTATTSLAVTAGGPNANASDLVVTAVNGQTYLPAGTGISDPPSSGYTSIGKVDTGSYHSGADAGYKIVSSIETSAATWTTTSAESYTGVIASFPSASGGSGGGGGSSGTGNIAYFPGTFISQWATLTSNTTLSYVQPQVLCNAVGGTFTITLPTAVNSFTTYHIKKTDSSGNVCTIATTNAQTIDGAATKSLSSQYQSTTVVSDNSNWFIQ